MRSEGSAYLDRTGRVIAADDGFRSCMGLPDGDATATLRARAEAEPTLGALLAGDGPEVARVAAGWNGVGDLEVARSRVEGGTLLRVRLAGGLAGPVLEHAMHSIALARIAGGVAHDVKNPLNALALQLALLGDKIGAGGEALAASCANNLASMKNQIGRVNDVVRRLADVTDPVAGVAFDLGALASDVASLFAHESRRRRVALACEGEAGAVHARGDPGRTARVLLGLVWRGLSRPGEDAKMLVRAAHDAGEALLLLVHGADTDPGLDWMLEVAARAATEMGGRFAASDDAGSARLELRLRRETLA
jgi:signal transduction histidine kinase